MGSLSRRASAQPRYDQPDVTAGGVSTDAGQQADAPAGSENQRGLVALSLHGYQLAVDRSNRVLYTRSGDLLTFSYQSDDGLLCYLDRWGRLYPFSADDMELLLGNMTSEQWSERRRRAGAAERSPVVRVLMRYFVCAAFVIAGGLILWMISY
jgi:hypothetical protein